jgi:hypothetical protein
MTKRPVLAVMDKLDTYAKMKREIAESEQKQKNSKKNANEKSKVSKGKGKGQQKGNNNGKSRESNQYMTHDGQHDWRNCPNNPCSKKFKGNNNNSKNDKAKSDGDMKMTIKGKSNQEAHFIQEQVTFQPKVDTINYHDPLENSESDKERDNQSMISAEYYFNSDDDEEHHGAISMTSDASDTNIHPITVISMLCTNGTIKATSCLIDQCCTGSGTIASRFLEILGLQLIQTSPHLFNTANGVLTTDLQVNLTHVKLPMLSKQQEFKISLQIVPQQVIMNHGVILGFKTMK